MRSEIRQTPHWLAASNRAGRDQLDPEAHGAAGASCAGDHTCVIPSRLWQFFKGSPNSCESLQGYRPCLPIVELGVPVGDCGWFMCDPTSARSRRRYHYLGHAERSINWGRICTRPTGATKRPFAFTMSGSGPFGPAPLRHVRLKGPHCSRRVLSSFRLNQPTYRP